MNYQIVFTSSAQRDIRKLDATIKTRVLARIFMLASDPRPHGSEKKQAGIGYGIRVGDYRILYDIDDEVRIVSILRVRHRREVYR